MHGQKSNAGFRVNDYNVSLQCDFITPESRMINRFRRIQSE